MTWDPRYTQRVSDLIVRRGLDPGIGAQLNFTGDLRLLDEIEAATDPDIAEVNRLWRIQQSSTQQGAS